MANLKVAVLSTLLAVIAVNPIFAVDASDVTYMPLGANAQQTTVEARLDGMISVKDFGAVGDGVTDDTTAISNAIAALSNGFSLYFPHTGAYYKTSGTIYVNKEIELIAPRGTLIRNTGNGPVLSFQSSACRATVRGLKVTATSGSGLVFTNSRWIGLYDVYADGCSGNGIEIRGCLNVFGVNVYGRNNGGHGLYVTRTSTPDIAVNLLCLISGDFSGNDGQGIVCAAYVNNLQLINCNFEVNDSGVGTISSAASGSIDTAWFEANTGGLTIQSSNTISITNTHGYNNGGTDLTIASSCSNIRVIGGYFAGTISNGSDSTEFNRVRLSSTGSISDTTNSATAILCYKEGTGFLKSIFRMTQDSSCNTEIQFGSARIMRGLGSPEGAVTAVVGSLYLRADGGVGTTLYIKESTTGSTGWVAK